MNQAAKSGKRESAKKELTVIENLIPSFSLSNAHPSPARRIAPGGGAVGETTATERVRSRWPRSDGLANRRTCQR
jgi:hypothetical protein